MKRPLFDMIDRQIMIEGNSFYASRMQLSIATAKLKRAIGYILEPIIIRLATIVNKKFKTLLI